MNFIIKLMNKNEKLGKLFRWGVLGSNYWGVPHAIGGGLLTLLWFVGFFPFLYSGLVWVVTLGSFWPIEYFPESSIVYAMVHTFIVTIVWELIENKMETPTDEKKAEIYGTVERFWYDQIGDVLVANIVSFLVAMAYLLGG